MTIVKRSKSALYVLIIIVLMQCIAGCENNHAPSKQAENAFNSGFMYFQNGNYYKAIELFNLAITLFPKYSDAYNFRGSSYAKIELFTNAIRDYDKAIELGSKNLEEVYLARGVAHADLKEYDKAIKDINKAIQISPNYALAYFSRGMIYADLNDYETAISDFMKADERDPSEDCKIAINKMQMMIQDKYDKLSTPASDAIKTNYGILQVKKNNSTAPRLLLNNKVIYELDENRFYHSHFGKRYNGINYKFYFISGETGGNCKSCMSSVLLLETKQGLYISKSELPSDYIAAIYIDKDDLIMRFNQYDEEILAECKAGKLIKYATYDESDGRIKKKKEEIKFVKIF